MVSSEHRMEALAHKGSVFISVIRKLMANKLPDLTVFERPRDIQMRGDSDSEDAPSWPIDEEIKNPFCETEYAIFKNNYSEHFRRYYLAKKHYFQNAQGKTFFECMGKVYTCTCKYIHDNSFFLYRTTLYLIYIHKST